MIIKKFVVESKNPEEMEFEITKITETTTRVEQVSETDERGNPLSAIVKPKTTTITKVKEGISALSLPSRTPAFVKILESSQSNEEKTLIEEESFVNEEVNLNELMNNTMDPKGMPSSLNLSSLYKEDSSKPIAMPKAGEITWADEN